MKKEISKKIGKQCAVCGNKIKVTIYNDKSYRDGYYFGKIPICSKKEKEKSRKSGTYKEKIHGHIFNVCNYDPRPYKKIEYWECPACYSN